MHPNTEGQEPNRERSRPETVARPHKLTATRTATTLAALAALGLTGASAAYAQPSEDQPTSAQDEHRPDGPVRTVMPGDSLWSVATTNGISVEELMEFNDLAGDASLKPGQHLRLSAAETDDREGDDAQHQPQADAAVPEDPAETQPQQDQGVAEHPPRTHEVRAGDSLWDLALEHQVTVAEIIEANELDVAAGLKPGQKLEIPTKSPGGRPAPEVAAQKPAPSPTAGSEEDGVTNNFPGYDYDDDTVAAANQSLEVLKQRPEMTPAQMEDMVRNTARDMGVDPALALAHAEQESGFNHQVVSPANAIGTMQVVPSAGEWAESLVGRDLDLLDPQDNVTAGVAIIRANSDRADNRDQAIGAYYQGLYGVQEFGMFDDTKTYVSGVKAKLKAWG